MPKATGYAALAALTNFRATQWFTKSIATLVDDISRFYGNRSEVVYGLTLSDAGTQSATRSDFAYASGTVVLGGAMTDITGATKDALAGGATPVLGAIMSDGTIEGISLTSGTKAFITIIAANSDGAGGTSTGNGAFLIPIIAGTGAAPTATEHVSTTEINSALAASSGLAANHDHSGVTHWCHVGQFTLDEATTNNIDFVDNRNNRLGV